MHPLFPNSQNGDGEVLQSSAPFLRFALAVLLLSAIPKCTSMDGPLNEAGTGQDLTGFENYPLTDEEIAYYEAQAECDAEYAAYEGAVRQISGNAAGFPFVSVRIENDTDASVRVWMNSYVTLPPYPTCDAYTSEDAELFVNPDDQNIQQLEGRAPFVLARGRANGRIKCGEFIVIVGAAPADFGSFLPTGSGFGIDYSGNVEFDGIGTRGEPRFKGDVSIGTWYLRPVIDGIDCENDTIVIRIDSTLSGAIQDPVTGQWLTGPLPGHGIVSIERPEAP